MNKLTDKLIKEIGFWNNKNNSYPDKPIPVIGKPWQGQEEFLIKLDELEKSLMIPYQEEIVKLNSRIGKEDPEILMNDLIAFHQGSKAVQSYRGSSPCRCCDIRNGYREFNYMGWKWPSGYMHYLRDHNVSPDEDFKNFIIKMEKK